MNVFLIGFMGSGKTSIGKPLAKQLEFSFIDLDAAIELEEKQLIGEIFSEKGADYFRVKEQKWLENYNESNSVISVGGGTPCFYNNLELMQNKGVTVYLTLPIKMMADRVAKSKTIRPLIEPYKHDRDDLVNFMTNLLTEREVFYKQADLIFEASNMTANKKYLLIEMINKCLAKKEELLK